jgi:hypothetical protein
MFIVSSQEKLFVQFDGENGLGSPSRRQIARIRAWQVGL